MKNIKSLEEYINEDVSSNPLVAQKEDKIENYMFFSNLNTIKIVIDRLMKLDPSKVDEILKDGHNWAEDHISTAKESIDQVGHFFENK